MNSPDFAMSPLRALSANVRMGWLMLRAEWPPAVWLVGNLLPELTRMLVFVMIGAMIAGAEGLRFALVGCMVLSIAGICISSVTDIPSQDVSLGTYRAIALGDVPAFAQYIVRACALCGSAVVTAAIVTTTIALITGQGEMVASLTARSWMLVPAVLSATMLGLVVIAPAIGSNWEGITYNAAVSLIVVLSGAVFAVTTPVARFVGEALPLTHTIRALRASLVGRPWAGELLLELVVAAGWCAVGVVVYRLQAARGRRTGRGAYAG